jgi:hypothetical protein
MLNKLNHKFSKLLFNNNHITHSFKLSTVINNPSNPSNY